MSTWNREEISATAKSPVHWEKKFRLLQQPPPSHLRPGAWPGSKETWWTLRQGSPAKVLVLPQRLSHMGGEKSPQKAHRA